MTVPSVLDAVTVYREGALCTRLAHVDPALDPSASPELRVTGLPLSLEPGSLRARVVSGPPGLTVRGVRATFDVELAEEIDVPLEVRQLEEAQDTAAALAVELGRIESDIKELAALRPRFREPEPGEAPRPADVSSMVALADFATKQLDQRLARRRDVRRRLDDAEERVQLRRRRLQEAGTARRSERARTRRAAVVTLSAPATGPVTLAIEYQVPGARWTPAYALRMDRALAGALHMRASVAQRTGEDWAAVRLSLSTASLLRRADVPELRSLRIGRTQPQPRRAGFREPPPGLDDLFASWDAAMRAAPWPERPTAEVKVRPPATGERRTPRVHGAIERTSSMSLGLAAGDRAAYDTAAGLHGPPPEPPIPAASPTEEPRMIGAMLASPPQAAMRWPGATPARAVRAARGTKPDLAVGISAGAVHSGEPPLGDLRDGAGPEAASFDIAPVPAQAPEVVYGLDAALLDYDRLRLGSPEAGVHRGRLVPAPEGEVTVVTGVAVDVQVIIDVVARARSEAVCVSRLAVPAGCHPATTLDAFDYRYDSVGRADVPSTGDWVSVAVMTCDVGLVPEFVCVPAVDPKVYRTVLVRNSSPHALLAGPCDVWAGDEFLLTAQLPAIPPGGDAQRLGLGVEEAIKVARRTHFRETSGGLFGGATLLVHDIEVEINNRLAAPVTVDVRERVPVAHAAERDLKIEEGEVRPPWEKVDEPVDGAVVPGARRWRVPVAPRERVTVSAQYTIRIPGDRMLVGGNRRG